ncbi:MAG: hypothetical protein V2A73_08340, partial [Pseudomonadota bacterium]
MAARNERRVEHEGWQPETGRRRQRWRWVSRTVLLVAVIGGAACSSRGQPDSGWSYSWGGAGWDEAFAIANTSDGGLVVAGRTESFGAGNYDAWVIKLDAGGEPEWQRLLGGFEWDEAGAVQ